MSQDASAAVAWLPSTPLLVPAISRDPIAAIGALRSAATAAVESVTRLAPPAITVVAPTDEPFDGDASTAVWSWHGFGVGIRPETDVLPWQLGLGAWLLDAAGWDGPRRYLGVCEPGPPTNLTAATAPGTGLLVLGDGSARGSERAPGHVDERSDAWDRALAEALSSGDPSVLAGIDRRLGAELLATAAVTYPLVAASLTTSKWDARLLHSDAPLGVRYQVAIWSA